MNGGAAWSALADIKAVHVSVAANSGAVPYTSLRKDAIAHKEVGVATMHKQRSATSGVYNLRQSCLNATTRLQSN